MTQSGSLDRTRRGRLLVIALLAGIVSAPLLLPWQVDLVQARRYGSYKKKGYGAYIGKCKRGCGATASAIKACARQALTREKGVCKAALNADQASCTGASCRRQVKQRFTNCVRETKNAIRGDSKTYSVGRCGTCCQKNKGQRPCQSYFQGSRFYGSSRYGGRLNCPAVYRGGRPSPAFMEVTDALRGHVGRWLSWLAHVWDHRP